jgi:hypothetical protein
VVLEEIEKIMKKNVSRRDFLRLMALAGGRQTLEGATMQKRRCSDSSGNSNIEVAATSLSMQPGPKGGL